VAGDDGGPLTEPAARLVVVRHASTSWSRSGRHTGRTDIPLDEQGRQAAHELRARLDELDVATVFSSPLRRALETCQIAGFGDRAQLTDDLLEWDYGDYEGLTTPQIWEGRPGWELFRDGCPNGESAADVGARVDHFLDQLAVAPIGRGDVVCFAHGHVLRVLAARWLGLDPEGGRGFSLDPAHLGALSYERETRVLAVWNR
jgi:broad specificity phosphatase PhoE